MDSQTGISLAVAQRAACGYCAARRNLASFAQRNGLTAQTPVLPTSCSGSDAGLSWRAAGTVPLKRFSIKRRSVDVYHRRTHRSRSRRQLKEKHESSKSPAATSSSLYRPSISPGPWSHPASPSKAQDGRADRARGVRWHGHPRRPRDGRQVGRRRQQPAADGRAAAASRLRDVRRHGEGRLPVRPVVRRRRRVPAVRRDRALGVPELPRHRAARARAGGRARADASGGCYKNQIMRN